MGKFLIFTLVGDEFGIDVGRVAEVINSTGVRRVPDLPEYVYGVITLRGEVVPLIDMRKRFGLVDDGKGRKRIVIVRSPREKVGILVDTVLGIVNYKDADISAPPEVFDGLKRKYILGLAKKGEKVAVFINFDNLLASEEMIQLRLAKEKAMQT